MQGAFNTSWNKCDEQQLQQMHMQQLQMIYQGSYKSLSSGHSDESCGAFDCRRGSDAGSADNWVVHLCRKNFFCPCEQHKNKKKNECTFFCLDEPTSAPLCAFCMPKYTHLRTLQIRRYVYRDVVKQMDVMKYMDVSGIQTYIINQAKVVFITAKGKAVAPYARCDSSCACHTCGRTLREGFVFCSLACKVEKMGISPNTVPYHSLSCVDHSSLAAPPSSYLSPSSSLKAEADLWHPTLGGSIKDLVATTTCFPSSAPPPLPRVKIVHSVDDDASVVFARNSCTRRKQSSPCRASN